MVALAATPTSGTRTSRSTAGLPSPRNSSSQSLRQSLSQVSPLSAFSPPSFQLCTRNSLLVALVSFPAGEVGKTEAPTKHKGRRYTGPGGEAAIARHLGIWWPSENKFFYGIVVKFDPQDGRHFVAFEDGDVLWYKLADEIVDDTGKKASVKVAPRKTKQSRPSPSASASTEPSPYKGPRGEGAVGRSIGIWWDADQKFYYGESCPHSLSYLFLRSFVLSSLTLSPALGLSLSLSLPTKGKILVYSTSCCPHFPPGHHFVHYDDGEGEWVNLDKELVDDFTSREEETSDTRQPPPPAPPTPAPPGGPRDGRLVLITPRRKREILPPPSPNPNPNPAATTSSVPSSAPVTAQQQAEALGKFVKLVPFKAALDEGLITQEDYDRAKEKVLSFLL